jgi:hypothetical protein
VPYLREADLHTKELTQSLGTRRGQRCLRDGRESVSLGADCEGGNGCEFGKAVEVGNRSRDLDVIAHHSGREGGAAATKVNKDSVGGRGVRVRGGLDGMNGTIALYHSRISTGA